MNMQTTNKLIKKLNLNIVLVKATNYEKYSTAKFTINNTNINIITDLTNYCYINNDNNDYCCKFNVDMAQMYSKLDEKIILTNLDKLNLGLNKTPVLDIDIYNLYKKQQIFKYQCDYSLLTLNKTTIVNNNIPTTLLLTDDQMKKTIINDIKNINSNNSYPHYIVPDNLSCLNVRLFLNPDSVLGNQLSKFTDNYIEIQLILDNKGFPFIAPTLNYIKPHAHIDFILSLVNLDILKNSSWLHISLETFILKLVEELELIKVEYLINNVDELDNHIVKLLVSSKLYKYNKINMNFDIHKMKSNKNNSSYWSSGTGYGYDDNTKWDINKYIKTQADFSTEQTLHLNKINTLVECKISIEQQNILINYIADTLVNINLLEYQKNMSIYNEIFMILDKIINIDQNKINIIGNGLKILYEEINYIIHNNLEYADKVKHIAIIIKKILDKVIVPIEEIIINPDIKVSYCTNMKKLQFKTNIQCGNCLSKVSPKLNEQSGIQSWQVDLQDPDRTLTVDTDVLNAEDIQKAVLKAGFIATLK
jgi:copper chaperone